MSNLSPRPASVSVDFGTSHTVVSIRRSDGRVSQQLFDGSPQLPSAVFADDDGGPVVGADAMHNGRRKPDRFEPNPKRRIDDESVLLGDQELPVTSVIAAVLSRVARECEQTLGGLGPVTVTVPAAWGPTRRHVVADAATAGGLGEVAFVPEPVAAASHFVDALDNDVPTGAGVVVYDLGAGTFDATVLRREATGFDVLAVDGADDLGGLDFDQALAEHLAATVQPEDERWRRLTAPADATDRRHRTAFLDEVRGAKERLSRSTSTDLTIPLLDVDVHLTREELETVAEPLIKRTVRITQGVIRESGLPSEQLAGVFLVGAASRTPLVATLLHRELGVAPAAIEQPELAVSEGGLLAHALTTTSPASPTPGQALPPLQAAPTPQHSPAYQSVPPTGALPGAAPGHHSPTGPSPAYQTGPMAAAAPPPEPAPSTPRSKRGMAIAAAAAAAVLVLAGVLVFNFLPDDEDGRVTAHGDEESETSGDSDAEAGGDAAAGEEPGTVDLASAAFGDAVVDVAEAHSGEITQIGSAEVDGTDVAITGGADGLIRIWELDTGELIDTYRGHQQPIDAFATTEDGDRTVVFSADGQTEDVWYLDDPGTPVDSRDSYASGVEWVGQWDGIPAYLAGYEVRQLFTGEQITQVELPYSSNVTLHEVDGTLRSVGYDDDRLFTVDLETGENVGGTFDQLPYEMVAVDFADAGGTSLGVSVTSEGSIQAWDLETAEKYGTTASEPYQAVSGVDLGEIDGRPVALVSGAKGLSLFDLDTGEQIGETFGEHTGEDELVWSSFGEAGGQPVALSGSMLGVLGVWSLKE